MSAPTCGSLFSGSGLLDLGLHLAGWQHAWLCESDEWRRELLRQRFPGVPVYDDVRAVRGEAAADASSARRRQDARGAHGDEGTHEGRAAQRHHVADRAGEGGVQAARPVDLIAGGFPCKGASTAGKREGFQHAETVLWHEMRRVIGELRPRYVLIENVANILGMAASPGEPPGSLWGTVLADLAALGFSVRWDCVPAGAVGAPHLRDRVFAVARHADGARRPAGWQSERAGARRARVIADEGLAAAVADADAAHGEGHGSAERVRQAFTGDHGDGPEPAPDPSRHGEGGAAPPAGSNGQRIGQGVDWGDYQPAITRWEAIHGPAPEPLIRRLDDGDPVLQRVRARVDRQRLSALGDGVHVYVGWLAGEYLMALADEHDEAREAA